jgi:hypothetical protein
MNADKVNFKDTIKAINVKQGLLEIPCALSLLPFDFHRRSSASIGG